MDVNGNSGRKHTTSARACRLAAYKTRLAPRRLNALPQDALVVHKLFAGAETLLSACTPHTPVPVLRTGQLYGV